MRRQSSNPINNRTNRMSVKPIRLMVAVICLVVGILITIPYHYNMWFTSGFQPTTWWSIIRGLGFFIGTPMFMYGFVSILSGTEGKLHIGSQAEQDIARVRHVVETDRMNRR